MIQEHKFGSFVINGRGYLGDIKILDSKVRYWDRKSHTVSFKDIEELLATYPDVIIIGTGNSELLKVAPEIKDKIFSHRIKLYVDKNDIAVKRYNQFLLQNKKISALFHATCWS